MATCPQCSNELVDDFGLVTCAVCGAQSFIDMDGEVKASGGAIENEKSHQLTEDELIDSLPDPDGEEFEPLPSIDKNESSFLEETSFSNWGGNLEDLEAEASTDEALDSVAEFPESLVKDEQKSFSDLEPLDDFSSEEDEAAPPETLEEELDVIPPLEAFESEETSVPEGKTSSQINTDTGAIGEASSVIAEIVSYANSSESLAEGGIYNYTIVVEGIDTKEIRQALFESIEDKKMGWDAHSLMDSIDNGRLVIVGVSPVKASILINQIKFLPVEIRWKQHDLVT